MHCFCLLQFSCTLLSQLGRAISGRPISAACRIWRSHQSGWIAPVYRILVRKPIRVPRLLHHRIRADELPRRWVVVAVNCASGCVRRSARAECRLRPGRSMLGDRGPRVARTDGARRARSARLRTDPGECDPHCFVHHLRHSSSRRASTLSPGQEQERCGMARPDDAEVAMVEGGDLDCRNRSATATTEASTVPRDRSP